MRNHITHIIATGVAAALVVGPVSALAASGTKAHTTAGTPKCSASQLHASIVDTQGALGTTYWDLALRNVGRTSCHMRGYPGVGLVDSNNGLINVLVERNPVSPVRTITVRPGQQAYFTFGYASEIGACTSHFSAHGIQIIPPNEFNRLVLRTNRFDVCTPSSAVGNPQVFAVRPTVGLNG
jgi:hypothetical protein